MGKIGFLVLNMDIKFILCGLKDLVEVYFCDDVDNFFDVCVGVCFSCWFSKGMLWCYYVSICLF